MTQQNIIDWLDGGWLTGPHVQTILGIGVGVNTDGLWGFQCMDFVQSYAAFMGHPLKAGNARTAWEWSQDPFWTKIPAGHIPNIGDIAVFKPTAANGNAGHISVVRTPGLSQSFISVDQNWVNPNSEFGSPPFRVTHDQTGLYGFLRPNNLGGDMDKDATIRELTRQRDDVANKLIDQEKVTEAVTKQRDDVAQKLIDTEIELDKARKALNSNSAVTKLAEIKEIIDK
jgi:hypothetical protein